MGVDEHAGLSAASAYLPAFVERSYRLPQLGGVALDRVGQLHP